MCRGAIIICLIFVLGSVVVEAIDNYVVIDCGSTSTKPKQFAISEKDWRWKGVPFNALPSIKAFGGPGLEGKFAQTDNAVKTVASHLSVEKTAGVVWQCTGGLREELQSYVTGSGPIEGGQLASLIGVKNRTNSAVKALTSALSASPLHPKIVVQPIAAYQEGFYFWLTANIAKRRVPGGDATKDKSVNVIDFGGQTVQHCREVIDENLGHNIVVRLNETFAHSMNNQAAKAADAVSAKITVKDKATIRSAARPEVINTYRIVCQTCENCGANGFMKRFFSYLKFNASGDAAVAKNNFLRCVNRNRLITKPAPLSESDLPDGTDAAFTGTGTGSYLKATSPDYCEGLIRDMENNPAYTTIEDDNFYQSVYNAVGSTSLIEESSRAGSSMVPMGYASGEYFCSSTMHWLRQFHFPKDKLSTGGADDPFNMDDFRDYVIENCGRDDVKGGKESAKGVSQAHFCILGHWAWVMITEKFQVNPKTVMRTNSEFDGASNSKISADWTLGAAIYGAYGVKELSNIQANDRAGLKRAREAVPARTLTDGSIVLPNSFLIQVQDSVAPATVVNRRFSRTSRMAARLQPSQP